jgi:hypothetical protein
VVSTLLPGKYRCNHPYLFQSVSAQVLPKRLPEGSDFTMDNYGPTHQYVDFQTGWLWSRLGGDWIDANGLRHGTRPWFSAPVVGNGASLVKTYQVDVTNAVAHCVATGRWCAFLLTSPNAPRTLAGPFHPTQAGPVINLVYRNGLAGRLRCRLLASNTSSSFGPITTGATASAPAFVEFERPTGEITSATMTFVVTEHWSGNNPTIDGYLLDPPVNAEPVRSGVAANAGLLDLNITAQSGVIGAQRYTDGTTLNDFALPEALNINAESNFDPAIYGTGQTDMTRLPHRGLGKWININSDWSLVSSGYRGEGFQPLAPGLGALRLKMPAEPGVTDGSTVGYSGTTTGNAMIYLPEALFGRLGRIFIRYYFRLGGAYKVTQASRRHVYHSGTTTAWTTQAGKFGIGADHSTSWGGVSGSSGGPYGWQMRHSWYDCDAETGGPDEGGWAAGYHLFDYYQNNPPGYNYGGADGTPQQERWGQKGGLGGMLYADKWYCIETEMKLNTLTNTSPGFLADGELRTWVDGRLAYDRTGMVFRSGPLPVLAYQANRLRPCRQLGVRGLWLNWFHGGKTVATFDRTSFYSGLVYGTEYIGPMKVV